MSTNQPRHPNSLLAWEEHFAPQVKQVELLGEISISREETQQLAGHLGHFIRARQSLGRSETLKALRRAYPCTFAVYLVAQAVHDEAADNGYWPDVDRATGLTTDSNWRSHFGQLFEEILKVNDAPLFPDVTAAGFRYLTLIHLHGGIPSYALPTYFERLLKPAVTSDLYLDLPVADLIEEWLQRGHSHALLLHQPLLRFLEFGGQIAADFVERTRELAREFLESGLVSPAAEIGLPERVTAAFHTWAVENEGFGPAERSPAERSGLRLRKPEIWLEPYGQGLNLELPPQQIPATLSQAQLEWRVRAEGQPQERIRLRLRRAGYDLRTSHETLPLPQPAAGYEISLHIEGETRRTWRYPGPTAERPLLVFDYSQNTLLRQGNSLPARPLWLLYPRTARLEFEGEAGKLKECTHPLPWGWAGYQGEAWDLSQATRLTLTSATGAPLFTSAIRPDEASHRPQLVGGTLFIAPSPDAPTPLYTGTPPAVRIPLVGRTGRFEELSRWRLTLRTPWAARPTVDVRNRPLIEFRPHLIERDTYVELPLHLPELLGPAPTGSYTLRLRGPLGRDAELPLRLLSHFFVTGHETIYLPDFERSEQSERSEYGPPEIKLLIETAADMTLEGPAEAGASRITRLGQPAQTATYEVVVPPKAVETHLTVVQPTDGPEPAQIPVRIPLRRLRWALATAQPQAGPLTLAPTGRMITQPLAALEQEAASPFLFVGYGAGASAERHPTEPESLSLHLVDSAGQALMDPAVVKTGQTQGSATWRFPLGRCLDTIRHSPSPVVRFELVYPQPDGPVRWPVLSLTRAMIVSQVKLSAAPPNEGRLELTLTWHEAARLRHRRVRFWPLWRAWLPPYEQVIPDEADGALTFQVPASQLPLGAYLAEFLVVDPYVGATRPVQPDPAAPNTAVVELIAPEQRVAHIKRAIQHRGPRFELFLERAHIHHQLGQTEAVEADCKQCYNYLDESTLPQILDLGGLMQQSGSEGLLGALRLKMFAANRVQRVLDSRAAGEISPAQFKAYFAHLPQKLLPVPTCELLLSIDNDRIKMYAVLQLVRRDEARGIAAVLELANSKTLSLTNAAEILKLNPDLAVACLEQHLAHPTAVQLLERVSPDQSAVVRVGHWVCSVAGWGQIQRIEALDSGQTLSYFIKGQSNLRLHLTLRPQYDAAWVTMEVLEDRRRLYFQPTDKLYRCTKEKDCLFITPDHDLLVNKHNRAAHHGLSPHFSIEQKQKFLSVDPLAYSGRAPRNVLNSAKIK